MEKLVQLKKSRPLALSVDNHGMRDARHTHWLIPIYTLFINMC